MTVLGDKDDEMEEQADWLMQQQLVSHAITAHNEYIRAFQRRANERIAFNRVQTATYLRQLRSERILPFTTLGQNLSMVFDSMHAMTTSEKPLPSSSKSMIQCQYQIIAKDQKPVTVVRKPNVMPCIPPKPTYTSWTGLSKSFEVEDEPTQSENNVMSVDDIVAEHYNAKEQRTSAAEIEFTKQIVTAVLKELSITWDLSTEDLRRAASAIQVDEEVVFAVHRDVREQTKSALSKRNKNKTQAVEEIPSQDMSVGSEDLLSDKGDSFEQYEAILDSYRSLLCRRCYVYDCDYHGCTAVPELAITQQNMLATKDMNNNVNMSMGRNCGNKCIFGRTRRPGDEDTSIVSDRFQVTWSRRSKVLCIRLYFILSGSFCDVARALGNKTCEEVAEFCEYYQISQQSLRDDSDRRSHMHKGRRKKRNGKTGVRHMSKSQGSSHSNQLATKPKGCAHFGPCDNQNCSCILDGVLCSKHCHCVHAFCPIFFHGCQCQRGRCQTNACPCYASGRECDPDICKTCCALIRRTQKGDAATCLHRSITRGLSKRVRVARSTLQSDQWGLYTMEAIEKDEFVLEYRGELVSHAEAERRGGAYERLDRSYLFNLDSETVVDSTRKGNKTRFINHSDRPNCVCRILNIQGDYRIGIFALHSIPAYSELFYDYKYDVPVHASSKSKVWESATSSNVIDVAYCASQTT